MIKIKSNIIQINKVSNYCPNFVQLRHVVLWECYITQHALFLIFFVISNYLVYKIL